MKKKVEEFFKKKFTLPEGFGCVCDTENYLIKEKFLGGVLVRKKRRKFNSNLETVNEATGEKKKVGCFDCAVTDLVFRCARDTGDIQDSCYTQLLCYCVRQQDFVASI